MVLINHRGLEQEGGLTNYSKRADTIRVDGATPLTTPLVQTNHGILQMAKKHFFGIISPGNLQNRSSDQKVLEVWLPKIEVFKAK